MKEKMVFAPASVLFLLFVFLKQFYLFPSGGMGAADVCLLLSFFILCMKGWLLFTALSQFGDSACFAWAFLGFTAYVR